MCCRLYRTRDITATLCCNFARGHTSTYTVDLFLNDEKVSVEIETGTSVRLLPLLPNKTLEPQSTKLRTYTGEEIPVLGSINVDDKYGKQSPNLSLSVVDTGGPNLHGRK